MILYQVSSRNGEMLFLVERITKLIVLGVMEDSKVFLRGNIGIKIGVEF